MDALAALPGVLATLDPYPAECGDNPICQAANEIIALAHEGQHRFNVFHQKLAVVRNDAGVHAYCGGIDINANRLDDRDHGVAGPYHDVHARVDGFAAGELARTFIERWDRPAAPGDPPRPVRPSLALAADGALDGLPSDGPDIVQVARTYFGPDPLDNGRRFPFAPDGERTILDTVLQAISQARRYIYIEDQYLTPPLEYAAALEAAANQVSGPLIILIPSVPDQPFGFAPRQAFVNRMSEAWGDRLKVGSLRQHFYRSQTNTPRPSDGCG
jgi:phosphatidylserine/phosphatidylglycerophosphate/cardiolipin synthase-like enzyme